MPTYKLIYFNGRGFAEQSRFVFAQAGVKYEDVRTEREQWPSLKPSMPYGMLPVLEVDGKMIGGSGIIVRYLGETLGLAGANVEENAQIASIVDAIDDVNKEVIKCRFEADETKKAEMRKKLVEETLPTKLRYFETRAGSNDDGWLYGKLTWADFSVYMALDRTLATVGDDALKDFPNLKKLRVSVEKLPNIAKWMKERPDTKF